MTQNGNDEGVSNINLTETPSCPGQTQQGKFYSNLEHFLEKEYPEFLPYLTTEEILIFHEGLVFYKHDDARSRAMKVTQHSDVVDKIPEDVLWLYWDRRLDEQKIKMAELRRRKKSHAGYELGAREFTLTYSPKWFSDDEARKQMSTAIKKLIKYYKDGDQRIIKL